MTPEKIKEEKWITRNDNNLGLVLFPIIRKESKFCSRCGKKLDLKYKDWHMPFCNKCRDELIKKQVQK